MGRVRLAVFAAFSAVFVPSAAAAFECTPSESSPFVSIHWNQRDIEWAIRAPGAQSIAAESTVELIQSAFNAWQAPRCSDLTFQYKGIVDPTTEPRDVSQVIFVQQDWVGGGRSAAAVALTTMTYGVTDGVIRFGIIEVNEEIWRFADALAGQCPADAYDLAAVVTHEVGHFIGLAHTNVAGEDGPDRFPTMTAMVGPCDATFRTLETDDIEGLCYIYPESGTTRQCATLPDQNEPYVSSVAFGCSATGRPEDGGLSGLGFVFFAAVLLRLARKSSAILRMD